MEDKSKMKSCLECDGCKSDEPEKTFPMWIACLLGIAAAAVVIVVFKMLFG